MGSKIPDPRRIKAARHYVENGCPPDMYHVSLLYAGYSKGTVTGTWKRMFKDPRTAEMIAHEQRRYDQKDNYNLSKAKRLLDSLKKDCVTANDRTNRLGCIKELDKIHGLYGDEDTSVTINQLIVSPADRKQALQRELKLLEDIEASPLCIAT